MTIVNKQATFLEICDLILHHKITSIDTEFIRENTYLPIFCLIQINVADKCYVIDPLSSLDLSVFIKILNDPLIVKILHSSRQDLEIMMLNFPNQINPQAIWDTQIMAALCGLGFNISYGNLVKNLLNCDVSKDWQRSDWQRRPLHLEQIEYAKIDVLYLPEIYQILNAQLMEKNKLLWAEEEMNLNIKKSIAKDDLCRNFSFVNKSFSYQKNVEFLVKWRDETAARHNVPRSFVIKDEVLDKIAFQNPRDLAGLEKCSFQTRILSTSLQENIKLEIINLINRGKLSEVVGEKENNRNITFKLNDDQKEIYQKSRILLHNQAEKYSINSELIINQTNLQHLIIGYQSVSKFLFGWRYEVFGRELEQFLESI